MKLIKSEIDRLPCPPKGDKLYFDDDLKGFGLRVTAGGAKVFIFQYHRAGRVQRMVLGDLGIGRRANRAGLTPARARELAEIARGKVSEGRDPKAEAGAVLTAERAALAKRERQAAAAAYTLDRLVTEWQTRALARASASHQHEAPAAIRRCFAKLLKTPADQVKTADAQKLVDQLAKLHPTMARRVRTYASAMANWAVGRELVTQNAFKAVRVDSREKDIERDRVLMDAELGAAWRVARATDYPFGPLLCLLILTLQRRTEVAGMRWSELDKDLIIWTLPAARAKNNKAHTVHLAEPARAILRELRDKPRAAGQTLIFTTTGKTPVSGFSKATERLHAQVKRESVGARLETESAVPWRLHDFRRTGVSTLARLGVLPHVADRLLNHVSGTIKGVAAVYQRHDFMAEREAALRRWADHVLEVAAAGAGDGAELPSNVIRLPQGRRGRSKNPA